MEKNNVLQPIVDIDGHKVCQIDPLSKSVYIVRRGMKTAIRFDEDGNPCIERSKVDKSNTMSMD